MNVSGILNYGS